MASNAFQRAAAAVDTTKNLETTLPGASFLDEGTHDVTIIAVDTSRLDDNKLEVIFADESGKQFRDSMFVLAQDEKEGFGFNFRWLLAGCIPNQKALAQFYTIAAENPAVLECFTGMKMRLILAHGPGIRLHSTGSGTYVGIDPAIVDEETGKPIPQTAEYAAIKDVFTQVKAENKKRSYLRNQRIEATDKETNLAAFAAAVAALTSAKSSAK